MKWTTKWLSVICSQSCVYVINATVTVAGSHGVAPSRPKRRKPTNDKLMTQQTTLQKIRFENGFAVAKSIIEYVMCRIEEIRLQLQGLECPISKLVKNLGMTLFWIPGFCFLMQSSKSLTIPHFQPNNQIGSPVQIWKSKYSKPVISLITQCLLLLLTWMWYTLMAI